MADIPLADQIAELKRELGMRKRLYPQWVRNRQMHEIEAAVRTARLEAAIATLEGLQPPKPQGEMFGAGAPR